MCASMQKKQIIGFNKVMRSQIVKQKKTRKIYAKSTVMVVELTKQRLWIVIPSCSLFLIVVGLVFFASLGNFI